MQAECPAYNTCTLSVVPEALLNTS